MSTNVVNLNALIPRLDIAVEEQMPHVTSVDKISIIHLEGAFFGPDLRKPDFQRETTQWTPAKVVELVQAFVDSDLIPAVILWRAGRFIFVVDGAHRLSALLAWIRDDYGDRKTSIEFFGGYIPDDQRKVAERTRVLMNRKVGSYQAYLATRAKPEGAPENMKIRLSNLSVNTIIAQWVPATDTESAERSFFKINQAATPIDPTERRLLRSRRSASAISSRAITNSGTGHKYWSTFSKDVQETIETTGKLIYGALYEPPMGEATITTLDVPVAGRGYNTLPFVFDLVNQTNDVKIADTTSKRDIKDLLPADPDGTLTVEYLKVVRKRIERITGDNPQSLGVQPVVYFYTRSGTFQPTAFLATSNFLERLAAKNSLIDFTRHRRRFEEFLIKHKEAMSLIVTKFGSGERSGPWLERYYERIFEGLAQGQTINDIQVQFSKDPDFAFLTVPRPSGVRLPSTKATHAFNTGTKNAAFFAADFPMERGAAYVAALFIGNP